MSQARLPGAITLGLGSDQQPQPLSQEPLRLSRVAHTPNQVGRQLGVCALPRLGSVSVHLLAGPPKVSVPSSLLLCPSGLAFPGFGVFLMLLPGRNWAASSALEGIHLKVRSVTKA